MKRLVALLALALPLLAGAQSKKDAPAPRVEYEKKTVINFEDDTIQGDLTRPDGEYVEARKKVQHSNLIKIREDWREKVLLAPDDL
ncbi:MAG TPA: adventurous gliding motility protein CglF [Anaeromyxobacteraceae bacterium]|nr:adventurous gliding motility protein CglF [Anaeromyxobacteraceae bacterium]